MAAKEDSNIYSFILFNLPSSKYRRESITQIIDEEKEESNSKIKLNKVPKIKTDLQGEGKDKILTFNELMEKVNSKNKNTFQPCTLSLRKMDARNRKILEGNLFIYQSEINYSSSKESNKR